MSKSKFPATIFITVEEPAHDEDPYLLAHEKLNDVAVSNGMEVAEYQLVKVRKVELKKIFTEE